MDVDTAQLRMLLCIPSVSERIARRLIEHFGTIRELQQALDEDLNNFPTVRLCERTCLGKTRIQKLKMYLC